MAKVTCSEPGCIIRTNGTRCHAHEVLRRQAIEAQAKAVSDFDILYDRAAFMSFGDIARKHKITRQRVQQRIDIAVRRQGVEINGYHPTEIRHGLVLKIGPTAVRRLRPTDYHGLIEENGGTDGLD